MPPESFANPKRLCDLVMKGGVTSGVVYPLAVCELAKLYSFKNIGGTSAGAIAAAAAAAAEYARRTDAPGPAGFDMLAKLPAFLGQPGQLVSLFTPSPKLASLFALATAAMRGRTAPRIILAVAGQVVKTYWLLALASIAAVVLVDYFVLGTLGGLTRVYTLATTVILAVVVFLGVVACVLYGKITRDIPDNYYALSKGFDSSVDVASANAPLTNWLTRYLNELAGKPLSKGLLTFRDLYEAPRTAIDPDPLVGAFRAINLEMVTTALNHGRPYRLPFRDPDGIFFFTREDFEQLFPKAVVDHMVANARKDDRPTPQSDDGRQLYGFPEPEHLPVVVATRMSLSFPLLLSAVPLYAVDFTRVKNQPSNHRPTAERCWFSDGGISSNLPIHFFDAPLPRWPTFGINLKEFHPDHLSEEGAVFLSKSANSDTQLFWNRFEKPGRRFSNFLFAIINTMQNWRDNTQSRVPGYRDRLVHVSQGDEEGGLNLNMLPATIDKLARRGQLAGVRLRQRFGENADGTPAPGWPDHRWVRLRSSMALTIDWLQRLSRGYGHPVPPDVLFEEMLVRDPKDPPAIYRLDPAKVPAAKATVDELIRVGGQLDVGRTGGFETAPKPTPELRIVPRI
jgi:hypothetical protein